MTSGSGEPGGGGPPLGDALTALLSRFRSGQRMALARAISLVEGERPGFESFLHAAMVGGTKADRVGLTGPPGAGKSSLVAQLAATYRRDGQDVGIVAVDPTSPFSGGALLGDRIRMNELATDPGIFIRSMATRGSLGGLAAATREVMDLMDAFGLQRLIVETVGVGQTELEITGAADTVVVVLVPESGDSIQAMKAGLMEIADIFVVNKADRPGADRVAKEIALAIHLRQGEALRDIPAHHGVDLRRPEVTTAAGARSRASGADAHEKAVPGEGPPTEPTADTAADTAANTAANAPPEPPWEIPVLKSVAQTGDGVLELIDAIHRHQSHLRVSGELDVRRRRRAAARVTDVVDRELGRRAWRAEGAEGILAEGVDRIRRGEATPYSVASAVVDNLIRRGL